LPPGAYAAALDQLHTGMRNVDVATPHFTDRVAEARDLAEAPDHTPDLSEADRDLLCDALRRLTQAINDRRRVEQLLHGEPHPGNVLSTTQGPLFVDLETVCRGPVEFDLAHVPVEVSARYPDVDEGLLSDCRGLVLAMVAAWRWDRSDEFPNGRQAGVDLLRALRDGPPYPTLDAVTATPPSRAA
jgi:thiamine kinase-like enzyme